MGLEKSELYGGLSGAVLPSESFDMGQGIKIERTYAYLFSTFMMAFARGEPGKITPAPWRAAKGGFSFEVHGQIHVPVSFAPEDFFDRLNTIWWFAALIRFRASPYIIVPVVADGPFANGPKDESITFWPMEIERRLLNVQKEEDAQIRQEDLEWIKGIWWNAGKLMNQSEEFNLLFQAHAQCIFNKNQTLGLMSLWGALEGVFSSTRTEVTFRVSSTIAAFLEPPGKGRIELQKKISKLYNARSQAAHGSPDLPKTALGDTYGLTKRVITKMVEGNHVPSRDDLENALLGGL